LYRNPNPIRFELAKIIVLHTSWLSILEWSTDNFEGPRYAPPHYHSLRA